MQGTLTVRGIRQPEPEPTPEPPKAPTKRNNTVTIIVQMDGRQYEMCYLIPISSTLMSGQKTTAGVSDIFHQMLTERFGRVDKL